MVGVKMQITEGVNKFQRLQVANLRNHHGEQGVRGDVERHAEKEVGAALIQLAAQTAILDMELEQHVAGWQRHFTDFRGIPSGDNDPTAVRLGPDHGYRFRDLVDRAAIRAAPTPPLRPVNPAKIAIFIRPFVPNTDAIVLQIPNVCLPAKKPEQLVDDRFDMDFFGRHEWKTFPQVEARLGAEQADRASPRAVRARTPLLQNQFEQAMVLEHG